LRETDSLPKKRALYTINSMIVHKFFRVLDPRAAMPALTGAAGGATS
jgi:hypothetical protein